MKKIEILLAVLLVFLSGFILYINMNEKVLKFPHPYILNMGTNATKYSCDAIVGSRIEAVSKGDHINKKIGVLGKLFKGTDKIIIEIKGNKLHFLTRASFEAGDSIDSNPFNIVYNNNHQLLAIDVDNIGVGVTANVFALNKDTGIAVWSKTQLQEFFTKNPNSQSYCLACNPMN